MKIIGSASLGRRDRKTTTFRSVRVDTPLRTYLTSWPPRTPPMSAEEAITMRSSACATYPPSKTSTPSKYVALLARILFPFSFLFLSSLPSVSVSAPHRPLAGVFVPWAAVRVCPLKYLEVPALRRLPARPLTLTLRPSKVPVARRQRRRFTEQDQDS